MLDCVFDKISIYSKKSPTANDNKERFNHLSTKHMHLQLNTENTAQNTASTSFFKQAS